MTDIKLSICIPTYNRARYLDIALECLAGADFSFAFEIVVSDNASTDDTAKVVQSFIERGLPINYQRAPVNAGAGPNLTNVIRHARGEYMVYQGDDDLLIPHRIEEVVAYLDANPDVTMCQAPWYLHDQITGEDTAQFYAIDAETRFERQDFIGVFELLIDKHVFPEIAVYRMTSVRSAFVPRFFCFWPFAYLAHFLDQGAVVFLPTPFYRSVTASTIEPQRVQAGNEEVMTSWDSYRGGLEYFLHVAAKRGRLNTSEEALILYERLCKIFTMSRISVAIRFWVARNDYIRAYELFTRMSLAGYGDHPGVGELREQFPTMVGLQTLAYLVGSIPEIRYLMFTQDADTDSATELLRRLGLPERVELIATSPEQDPALRGQTAVLFADDDQFDRLLALGYDANFLFRESDLTRYVLV